MPTVGLSMIVKNEAHTLEACLESVRGVVSQIVIADTGSTDNTIEIARRFGATVVDFPWQNHFANARNAALEPVTADWVLVLDADEELDHEASKRLPALMAAPGVGGYLTPIRNYIPTRFGRTWDRLAVENDGRHPRAKNAPGYVTHENCRFFQRRSDIYFIGRIHELVEHRIRALGLKLPTADFCIHHFGRLIGEEAKQQKASVYRDLLRLKVQENPNDPVSLMELGLQEIEFFQNPEEALRCFRRALAADPLISQAWLFTGMAELRLGRPAAALDALQRANRDGVGSAIREHWIADALVNLGRWNEAEISYRRALKLAGEDPLLESKLGFVEVRLGQTKAGIRRLKNAVEALPQNLEVRDALIKSYIVSDRLLDAAKQAEECAEMGQYPKLYLRAASIYSKAGNRETTLRVLSRGLERFPESPELRRAQGEFSTNSCDKNTVSVSHAATGA